jgi:hypothetical protein
MHTREISSLNNRDVTVLIAKHAVQVTYYQSNHHISLMKACIVAQEKSVPHI